MLTRLGLSIAGNSTVSCNAVQDGSNTTSGAPEQLTGHNILCEEGARVPRWQPGSPKRDYE